MPWKISVLCLLAFVSGAVSISLSFWPGMGVIVAGVIVQELVWKYFVQDDYYV